MKCLERGRKNEGRNDHHSEIFRRKEGRMNEGRNEHYEIFRKKEGVSIIIMKYLE